jgi:hypothetical protein
MAKCKRCHRRYSALRILLEVPPITGLCLDCYRSEAKAQSLALGATTQGTMSPIKESKEKSEDFPLIRVANTIILISFFLLAMLHVGASPSVSSVGSGNTNYRFVRGGGDAYVKGEEMSVSSAANMLFPMVFIPGIVVLAVGASRQRKVRPETWINESFGDLFSSVFRGLVFGAIVGMFFAVLRP